MKGFLERLVQKVVAIFFQLAMHGIEQPLIHAFRGANRIELGVHFFELSRQIKDVRNRRGLASSSIRLASVVSMSWMRLFNP